MSVAYTPWGDVLAYYGNGGIDFGYLGGVYDENTGLIYMGNGRYYDPVTGRMLTRGAGQSNPYKPGAFDPAGMMVAPLGLLGLVMGRKKKRGKWDSFIILLVVGVVVGMSVSACNQPSGAPAPTASGTPTPLQTSPATSTKTAMPTTTVTVTPTMATTDETAADDVNFPCYDKLYYPPTSTPVVYDSILDVAKLKPEKSKYTNLSGLDYYDWYKRLWENKAWDWWTNHSTFTVWDFFTLIIHIEIGEVGNSKNTYMYKGYERYKEAVVRVSYQWCEATAPKVLPNKPEGALNWLAWYSESGKNRYGNRTIEFKGKEQWDSAQEITDALQNPQDHAVDEDWTEGFAWDQPYGVGNLSLFEDMQAIYRVNYAKNTKLYGYLDLLAWWSGDSTGNEILIPTGCGSYILYGDCKNYRNVCAPYPWPEEQACKNDE